jgi:hypothetical protein
MGEPAKPRMGEGPRRRKKVLSEPKPRKKIAAKSRKKRDTKGEKEFHLFSWLSATDHWSFVDEPKAS